jgi:biopolymer transport protein ExbB
MAAKRLDTLGIFSGLANKAVQAAAIRPSSELSAHFDQEALITRTLRQEINVSSAKMESGLTILASVGSVSPFIGLFGTVWGIYHALINIAANGQVLIDKVAGPVGEALIMTAAGLAVAIPAVLAYNAFVRANRVSQAQLDSFAYDLLGVLTAGKRVG